MHRLINNATHNAIYNVKSNKNKLDKIVLHEEAANNDNI